MEQLRFCVKIFNKIRLIMMKRILLAITLCVFIVFTLVTPIFQTFSSKFTDSNEKINIIEQNLNVTKYIMFWTPMYSSKDHYLELENGFQDCLYNNCHAILDKSQLNLEKIDAFLFHGREYEQRVHEIPHLRLPNQVYIFSNIESPVYTLSFLKQTPNFYNWTMTYRLDSDILRPYGRVIKKESNYTLPTKEQLKKKTSNIAWVVSHCGAESQRDLLVKGMQKFMDVDVYGGCGSFSCPLSEKELCINKIASEYKFYLALENSYCKDYATEKLFDYLAKDIVPIVYGGANYSEITPKNSVINVENFETAEELVNYLKFLIDNPKEYLKYFEWKKYYIVDRTYKIPSCDLCEQLNQPLGNKTYGNIYDWWSGPSSSYCKHGKDLPKIVQ